MELKDLELDVVDMKAVRGGLSLLPFGGNHASNISTNGPVASAVMVGGSKFNNSPISVTNEVVQMNTTTQGAKVHDLYSTMNTLDISGSQLSLGGFFGR